jgi:hypothetical protein
MKKSIFETKRIMKKATAYLTTTILFFILMLMQISFAQSTTFNYTGSVQTYTVPSGVTQLQIEAYGAQGGGDFGGNGGSATGIVPVTPGAVLEVYVGGKPTVQLGPGGFNGGGAVTALPCGGPSDGWPGGGASDVRTTSSLSSRIIVAGGGGGQGYSNGIGGLGGGSTGGNGAASWISNTNGKGGTQIAGGEGGVYSSGPSSPAPSGSFGTGGNSGPTGTYCTGGAGGGGWYGGGGGYVSAGGGGSSYVSYPGTTSASTTSGVNAGNGYVIITVLCSGLTPNISATSICQGESLTLAATSSNGGSINWNNGVINGVSFIPQNVGTTTYTATSSNSNDCPYSVVITINPLPTVSAGNDISICPGNSVTLTASGNATNYSWSGGISDGIAFTPSFSANYIVTGTNTSTGCEATSNVNVDLAALPIVSAGPDQLICNGGTVTLSGSGNASTYTWNNGVLNGVPFNQSNGSVIYIVTGISSAGCISTDSVVVTIGNPPVVNAGNDISICLGTSISLTGTGNANTYTWNNGIQNGVPFIPAQSAVYSVTGTNTSTGCQNTDNVSVTVNPIPDISLLSSDELLGNDGSITLTILTGTPPFTYDWSNDGIGDNDDNINISNLDDGIYSVIVTDANGCEVIESVSVDSQLGVEEENYEFSIYPNPATKLLTLQFNEEFSYHVFNLNGQILLSGTGKDKVFLDLSELSSGIYQIHMQSDSLSSIQKILKY